MEKKEFNEQITAIRDDYKIWITDIGDIDIIKKLDSPTTSIILDKAQEFIKKTNKMKEILTNDNETLHNLHASGSSYIDDTKRDVKIIKTLAKEIIQYTK